MFGFNGAGTSVMPVLRIEQGGPSMLWRGSVEEVGTDNTLRFHLSGHALSVCSPILDCPSVISATFRSGIDAISLV
jgi:hypothetical protein